jgi:hypothetical protein
MVGVAIAFLFPIALWLGSTSKLRAVAQYVGRALVSGAAAPAPQPQPLPSVAAAEAAASGKGTLARGDVASVTEGVTAAVVPGWREMFARLPTLDARFVTPYTPWATWWPLPEAVAVAAVGVLAYVFVDGIRTATGKA